MAAKPGIARSDGTPGNFLIGKLASANPGTNKEIGLAGQLMAIT